ncbi:TonB-dependent receptor [Hyphococcus formosus]|uniref:TonB-dependent receptor n=1 Tax=Hyphococcus formosus TaxID=3143534 RepID=UPI00398AD0F2
MIGKPHAKMALLQATALATLLSGAAHAQSESQAAETNSRAGLDTIVITARKVEENLQDVPIAVTALGGEQLKESQITDLSQIAGRVPSFTYQSQNSMESEIFIRGVGSVRLNGATADASVGTFIDEIYIGRRGSATPPIFDLERLEVLRGPQGTLFGKNVVGGALSLVTAKPQFEFGGGGYVSYGNYNTIHATGHVTGPITENVALRLALYQNRHDGYAENIVRNEELEDLESYAGRISLLWNLNDNMTLNLSADASTEEGGGPSRHSVDNPFVPGFGPVSPNLISQDPRTNESPYEQYARKETAGITARFEWDMGPVTATYLGAFRKGDGDARWTQAGAGAPPSLTDSTLTQLERHTGITQEIRFASAQDQRFRWLAGLYYLDDNTRRQSRNTAISFLPGGAGSTRDILDGDNEFFQVGVSKNYAAFGEVAYDITDDLTITAGGRYTIDKKTWDIEVVEYSLGPDGMDNIFSTAPVQGEYQVSTDDKWSEFTPKVTLDWRFADGKIAYLSAAKGFKGGGWQGGAANATAAETPYSPETAWTYEAGLKTDLFDNRVRFNLAAFYTDFKDLQVELLDDVNLVLVVANAADATIKGVEAEFQGKPHDYITIFASGSYLDAEYKNYIDPLRGIDYSGNQIQRTPEYQFNVGGNFEMPISNNVNFVANADYGYQAKMFYGPANTNLEPGYGLLDLRAGIAAPDGSWSLQFYGRNMTDKLYRVSIIPFAGDEFSAFGAPRTYGIKFATSF